MYCALATCEKFPSLYDDDRLLLPELERLGIKAQPVIWTDETVDWSEFDAVIIRSTWDYYTQITRFRDWLAKLERMNVRVWNPVPVILGNIDKNYLRTLEQKGAPIVPTAWIEQRHRRSLAQALNDAIKSRNEFATAKEFVLKPTISAGAHLTFRFKHENAADFESKLAEILTHSDAMLQPFLPVIENEGEWSFLFFGGEFSHAVLKSAKSGDYRVQFTFGGTTTPQSARPEWIEQARSILTKAPGPLLYARVDMIRQGNEMLLGELELTEPCLFLSYDAAAPAKLAEAIKLRVHPKRSKS